MALKDDLESWWALDETSGDAIDSHGENTLSSINSVGSAVGKVSNARDFSNSETFEIASNPSLVMENTSFSFFGWMTLNASNLRFLVSKGGSAVSSREYGMYMNSGTFVFFVTDSSSNTTQVTWPTSASLGVWYFVECFYDHPNNQIGIAVNDGVPSLASHTTGVRVGTYKFELGGRREQNFYHDGLLDEWGFLKRLITRSESEILFNSGNGISYSDLVSGNPSSILNLSRPQRRFTL